MRGIRTDASFPWRRPLTGLAALLIGVGVYGAPAVLEEQEDEPLEMEGQEESVCGTDQRWQQSGSPGIGAQSLSFGACPTQGTCDEPAVRDPFIPEWNSPIRNVTLQVNVLCNDAGTACRSTPQQVATAMLQLKNHFDRLNLERDDSRIRFLSFTRFINDSRYMSLPNLALPNPDDFPMKDQYALSPATLLNIWVTDMVPAVNGIRGLSTYPWDPLATQPRGGILVHFQEFNIPSEVLTHEIGHALGLWHTHRGGTSQEGEPMCHPCWESTHFLFDPNADHVGDYCSDTYATDPTFFCTPTVTFDTCISPSYRFSFFGWDPENFMAFGPTGCRLRFSDQQMGRMHCWSQDAVSGWVSGQSDTCAGAGPIHVGRNYGTTIGATATAGIIESNCDDGNDGLVDVWYKYVSQNGGPVTLSLCGTGTSFDSQVSVHTSCGSPQLTEVGCSESRLNCGLNGSQGRMTFQATAGQTFFIRVTNDSGGPGDFELLMCETGSAGCEPPPKIRIGQLP